MSQIFLPKAKSSGRLQFTASLGFHVQIIGHGLVVVFADLRVIFKMMRDVDCTIKRALLFT
mgnify:CR=1 FL=1